MRRLFLFAVLPALALVLVGPALAAPPTLLSVGHVNRHPTATWSLPPNAESWAIEVATSTAAGSDGDFFPENVVDDDLFFNTQTSWTSSSYPLKPGTYYVHVSASDTDCYFAGKCPVYEWSNVMTLVIPAPPPPPPLVIRGDRNIAGFQVKRDGKLRGAIRALGRPSSRTYLWSGEGCRVAWRGVGARMLFYNLGGEDPCDGRYGYFSDATMTGKRWRTDRGLAIGDARGKLRRLYPNARYRRDRFFGNGWWLVTRTSRYGTGGGYPGLFAQLRYGRVAKFVVTYPAGGD